MNYNKVCKVSKNGYINLAQRYLGKFITFEEVSILEFTKKEVIKKLLISRIDICHCYVGKKYIGKKFKIIKIE